MFYNLPNYSESPNAILYIHLFTMMYIFKSMTFFNSVINIILLQLLKEF